MTFRMSVSEPNTNSISNVFFYYLPIEMHLITFSLPSIYEFFVLIFDLPLIILKLSICIV